MTDFFSPKDIQKLLDQEDKAIEAFVAKLKNKIERRLKKAVNNLDKAKTTTDILRELSKVNTLNLPDDIKTELKNYVNLFSDSIKTVQDSIKTVNNINQVFSSEDQALIDNLFNLSQNRLIATIEQTFSEFKTIAYQGYIANNLPDLNSVAERMADGMEGRLPSDINTQLAGFQRAVTLKKSDDLGLTHFLYAGGLIKTSRDFCVQRAGKIFTFKEAKTWNNGQGLPVIPYLGGYNCRHSIVPMTEEKAIEQGYSSGE